MDTLIKDLRYAARALLKRPGFTVIATITLALGIGAATAIFSVVNGVLLRPLPYPEPDRLVRLWQIGEEGGRMNFSHPNFEDVRERTRSFDALAESSGSVELSVTGGSEPVRTHAVAVSPEFFGVIGVEPAIGRTFSAEEEQPGGPAVVLVSHDFWRRYLGGDRDVSGRTLSSGTGSYAVIGVMPPGFGFPTGTDLWVPQALWSPGGSRTAHNWQVYGRLAEGVTVARARSETSGLARQLRERYGDDTWMVDAAVVPLHEQLVGHVRPALLVLFGAAGFLLLIACANVANLLLARAADRRRELAVRSALGASRGQLVRQFISESLLLTTIGGSIGVLLAFWGVDALLAVEPGRLPRLDQVGVNPMVLGFALALSVATALGLGATIALRATGTDVQGALGEGGRSQAGGSSQRVRGALVAAQVALTLVLLVGAGLLGRSLYRLLGVDPGFRTQGAVTMSLRLPSPTGADGAARLANLHSELIQRLSAIPGVERVGGINYFPLRGGGPNGMFLILNRPDEMTGWDDWGRISEDPDRTGFADFRVASEGYFRTMEIPLVRGRLFEERDAADAAHVAVISETLAQTRWPNEDPVGKLIQFGNMDGDLRPFRIVGIVGDVRERGLDAEPRPTFYAYYRQRTGSAYRFTYVIQGGTDEAGVIAAARRITRTVAPAAPPRFRPLEEIFSDSVADRRFSVLLLGAFGAAALALALLGIYGVVAYSVSQRTREIGLRMALGARTQSVALMVVRQGAILAGIGLVVGVPAALGLTRLLRGMLYGIEPTDPTTLVGVALLLGGVAVAASYLPARRAARVDPMNALRDE